MGWCGSASQVSFDHRFRVPVSPEHLGVSLELRLQSFSNFASNLETLTPRSFKTILGKGALIL